MLRNCLYLGSAGRLRLLGLSFRLRRATTRANPRVLTEPQPVDVGVRHFGKLRPVCYNANPTASCNTESFGHNRQSEADGNKGLGLNGTVDHQHGGGDKAGGVGCDPCSSRENQNGGIKPGT